MDKIYVAKLGRAVGLKGQQKLIADSDFPEQFKKDAIFYTDKNQELKIETFNPKNNTVKFVGIDDINQAKKLTNRQLFVSENDTRDMCNLGDKQFFWFYIMDCQVIENGQVLGVINDIQRMPLSDYLQIETTKEIQDKGLSNIFLLPYTDDYIINVDCDSKTIEVKNAKDILEAS